MLKTGFRPKIMVKLKETRDISSNLYALDDNLNQRDRCKNTIFELHQSYYVLKVIKFSRS